MAVAAKIARLALAAWLAASPATARADEEASPRTRKVLGAWQRYKSSRRESRDRESGLVRLRKEIWDDPPPPPSKFDRSEWKHWIDADGDCQDTRTEVLIRDNTGRLRYARNADGDPCQVTAGTWICPHTGEEFRSPEQLDVDHVVPLEHAWQHGGFRWSAARREAFANDLANLEAVSARSNRSKGRLGILEWVPCMADYHPEYFRKWFAVKRKYRLHITARERKLAERLRSRGSVGPSTEPPAWCDEEDG